MIDRIWEHIIRLRNWIVTAVGSAMILLPELLAAPEVLAVLPPEYHKWVFVTTLLLNLAMRWRPASMASDAEVKVKKAIDKADGPVSVEVKEAGKTKAAINA